MRIAVVSHNLRVAGGASVGRNIIATLPVIAPMHSYLFVVPRGQGYESISDRENIDVVETDSSSTRAVAMETVREIPRMLRQFSPDLIWTLGNFPIRHSPARQALLVHDPHLFYPAHHSGQELWRYKQMDRVRASYLRHSLRFVEVVFCQTRAAADRFQRRYDYPNVAVMPNAVSDLVDRPDPTAGPSTFLASFAGRFKLFALTRYYAHKNLELIVDAYRACGTDLLAGTACFLTIDSSQHPRAQDLLRRISRETPDQIVNLGPLPQELVGTYFREMDALLHPSTLESFSASYLEAMAFGVPIIASDFDFARVICGEAAIYFDSTDPLALGRSVKTLRDDPKLRDRLVTEGKRQLASISADWATVLRSALDILRVPHF